MKKIIFDLDNTLLFVSNDWEMYYKRFIDKYKLDISPKDLYSILGIIEENVDIIITKKQFVKYINDNSSISITLDMLHDFFNIYAEIPLLKIDTVYSLLSYLSAKYELIAYSNWFAENQILRLKKNNLQQFFTKVYGCEIIPIKPSKRGLKSIIGNNSVTDYVFIGDSIEIDLELPNSMGIDTILYNRKNIKQQKYKEVRNIEDFMKLL